MPIDRTKYEVVPDAPKKFAMNIKEHGHMQFVTEHLTDNDCAVLVANDCPYVKPKGSKSAQ